VQHEAYGGISYAGVSFLQRLLQISFGQAGTGHSRWDVEGLNAALTLQC